MQLAEGVARSNTASSHKTRAEKVTEHTWIALTHHEDMAASAATANTRLNASTESAELDNAES